MHITLVFVTLVFAAASATAFPSSTPAPWSLMFNISTYLCRNTVINIRSSKTADFICGGSGGYPPMPTNRFSGRTGKPLYSLPEALNVCVLEKAGLVYQD